MTKELTLEAWRARLEARGHHIIEAEGECVTGFTLWPDEGTTLPVAVDKDGTLYPRYRQRFFLCEIDPELVLRGTACPEPHRGRWAELVSLQPPSYWHDFLAGPGSWLLSRLARSERVVAWSDRGLPGDGLDEPAHRAWEMEVPSEAAPFFAATTGPEAARPRVLPVPDRRFADAVAACVLFASVGNRDCYLADEAGGEVYLAHHHEKVVVSIPDAPARAELLQELGEAGWLVTDVSGYRVPIDEEEDPDGP